MSIQFRTAGETLLKQAGELAEWITDRQYARQPDLLQRFGPSGRIRTKQDTLYSLNYLAESVLVNSPALFIHYVSWLKALLEGYHVTAEDVRVNLGALREAIVLKLDHPDKAIVLEYLDLGMKEPASSIPSYIDSSNPLAMEAEAYLSALLDGDRRRASTLIHALLNQGTDIKSLYQYIFQVTQYEIGRLWHKGSISVAQEHYCTAVTQSIISGLYPHWIGKGNKGLRMVAACVGSELHEIGLRMVADTFEMEGWDTYYLGANVPDDSLIQAINDHKAHIIAISVTMTFHIHLAKELITKIKAERVVSGVKIMVGGLPFNLDPNLWKEIGADGYAPDAETTVILAEQLIASSTTG
ncbi:cobalamin B12-binding domain-containing protein [Paenibacillus faecalis]|uniref:cobalamin B12-binding domain-containing protein n=1 Tax=Paenibacillus faecalis TaxID=2079532 RepID=UPI000D10B928|nr:cobalamin-dependent protein [Paenibacillus faecalis]